MLLLKAVMILEPVGAKMVTVPPAVPRLLPLMLTLLFRMVGKVSVSCRVVGVPAERLKRMVSLVFVASRYSMASRNEITPSVGSAVSEWVVTMVAGGSSGGGAGLTLSAA